MSLPGVLGVWDVNFHSGIGGTFVQLVPAMDPLIYVLHAFSEKLMSAYQAQGPEFYTGGGTWNNDARLIGMCLC